MYTQTTKMKPNKQYEQCISSMVLLGTIIIFIICLIFFVHTSFPVDNYKSSLIYIHPGFPHKNVIDTYYNKFSKTHPMILTAGWGFTFETATTASA